MAGVTSERCGLTRRRAIGRGLLATAGVVAGGGMVGGLSGVAEAARRAAAPTRGSGVIQLVLQAQWNATWNPTAQGIADAFVAENFNRTHPGIRAKLWPFGSGGSSGIIAASLAGGTVPDIIADCCTAIPTYIDSGWLVPLDPFLKQDNINTGIWSKEHVAALNVGGHQYGLPSYEGPAVMVYRQDLLDQAGVAYPNPDWTYTDAVKVWEQSFAVQGTQKRAGASLEWVPGINYLLHGWGGTEMDSTRTRCLLDSTQAISAGQWFYDLIFRNVVVYRNDVSGLVSSPPQEVFSMCGGWDVFNMATQLGYRYKWDILPMPKWPTGFATFVNSDFYGINRATKHLDAAWELLKWMAVEPMWTRFEMRTTLTEPALLSLWDEWEGIVTAAAPPLNGKALYYFKDAALSGRTYPHIYFRSGALQADTIIADWFTKIGNHQVSVVEGFTQAAHQVNAWEQEAGAAFAKQATAFAAAEKVPVTPATHYPAPPVAGLGVPATPTPYILTKGGVYTLLGDGWDCWNASDNATFAAIPVTATEGEWTCRVTAITNLSCPHLSQWAKIGLMARGDLTDDSPMVSLHLTGAHDIEWESRMQSGQTPNSQSGLVPAGAGSLLKPNTQKHANYVIRPVWLKMQRHGLWWTAWSSFDGKDWTAAGTKAIAETGGCWVGVMACSHNGSFNNIGYVRAVIDGLNFRPTRMVQLGNQGTPPAAGKVPANWASV